MTITQKDIAERLHLSIMTVSKALANHPDVADKTREQVIHAAKEMNYRVNRIARSLVQRKTNTIGVIVPDVSELFYAEVLNGIESVTRSANYTLLLANTDNDPDIERKSIQILLETRVDGLLFCPTEKNDLSAILPKAAAVPIVLFNNASEGFSCDTVRVDRGAGAYQSVRYLIQKGYEEIYFFHTFAHMSESRNSVEGCIRAFRESGLPMERLKLVLCPERRLELFHQKAAEEIEYGQRRIGIFAWDDEMAVGIYRAVIEKGLAIPDPVGLVGFDDIRIARYLPKALTTVCYPKFEMGKVGAEMLIRRIERGESRDPDHVILDLKLVPRETA
jgi:DNA-binding LacI/PurR family transcriptional regulator